MPRVNPMPSNWLKAFAALSHGAMWILAAAWISLGLVWGGLHFLIVPRIDILRPWLEQQASQRMGIPVRVGDIVARSNGLIPSIELRDVRLLDSDGRIALRLPSVLAALSPRSALGLGFEQLYIDSPELDVRRTADGRIWIAGLALPDAHADGSAATEWLFSQTELALRHGTVRWTDELRGQPTLALSDVDLVSRNRHSSHALRREANPPSGWGTRLSLLGRFQQGLFSTTHGDWRNWTGQLYAEATQIDLAQLGNYVNLGLELRQGAGSLRAWMDVDHAQLQGATADLALQAVNLRLTPTLEPLDLERVSGRLGLRHLDGGYELRTQALAFDTRDGLHWPGGNLQLSLWDASAKHSAHGSLVADRLELAALAEIASRLPLPEAVHAPLRRLAPTGLMETLQLDWQGEPSRPQSYAASGRVSALALAAQSASRSPGVRGASVDFKLDQNGGKASLQLQHGALEFPGLFDRPELALDALSAELQWKLDGNAISVAVDKLRFANADAQGDAQLRWQSAPLPRGAPPEQRFPGVLDLSGSLSRGSVAAVPHYLPLLLNAPVRAYLAQALLGGEASNVRFKLKGDLSRFPFTGDKGSEFRISADIHNASYAYAPALVLPKDSAPWPLLTQVDGEFVLDHDTLQIKGAHGLVASGAGLPFSRADGNVSHLYDGALVQVSADARAPLAEVLALVNSSPLGAWTGGALARSTASGLADYKLKLTLPLAQLEKTQVQGSVALAGNDFLFSPGVPRLSRVRGQLAYTESGFSLAGVQARALGGDVRIDGGMAFGAAASARTAPTGLRLQGQATAEGLRQASELGLAARLAQFSTGSAAYSATLGLRGGVPELSVSSSLSGLALNLPEPFTKSADSVLPLRLENTQLRAASATAHAQDQWLLELGRLASVSYVRDTSVEPAQVLRGAMALGLNADEAAPLPAEGVVANLRVGSLDVDAWSAVLSRLTAAAPGTGNGANTAAASAAAMAYLPSSVALRARELLVDGRTFNQVLLGGVRDGATWRGNVDASELNGYVEYRQSSGSTPGRVYARLAHLVIGQSAAQDVENLLDQQPQTIPALDIVVDDLDLRGKKLGRVEVQAVNLGLGPTREAVREWRLNRFNISTPEATLTASGNWVDVNAQAPAAVRPARGRRRTALTFKLDVADSGELLQRMGMPGVIAKGKGVVAGQVSWLGSPFSPDYPSMGGGFNVNMESGQFLKADPGVAKLLGVLSLQSLPRRLALDFRDVFSDGFAFDFVRGDVAIEQGIARTGNLQMKGVNAIVMMDGQADIAKETQSIKVLVIPEINVASASLLYSAINPLVGLTTFLANLLLRGPLVQANTQEFLLDGSWLDPHVTKIDRKPDAPVPSPVPPTKR